MMFPKIPINEQIVIDYSGERYKYHKNINQWVDIGRELNSHVITPKQDGIITPSIADLLINVKEITAGLKLQNNKAYYYLFKTPDKSFIFSVEDNDIRIEINRSSINNLLFTTACQGKKGLRGPRGYPGKNGTAGPLEATYTPIISGDILTLRQTIPSPLDTEISLRLYNTNAYIEIWYKNGVSTVIQSTKTLNSIDITHTNGIFTANITSNWEPGWTAKVRQRGPAGLDGEDGTGFIELTESDLYGLEASQTIVSLRNSKNDLFYIRQDINDLPTPRLRSHTNNNAPIIISSNEVTPDKFAAVNTSLDNNKEIYRWQFETTNLNGPSLNLHEWEPDPSCATFPHSYDWADDSVPVEFKETQIADKCCQEDFYFCPNGGCSTDPDVVSNGPWVPIQPIWERQ